MLVPVRGSRRGGIQHQGLAECPVPIPPGKRENRREEQAEQEQKGDSTDQGTCSGELGATG